MTNWSRFWLIMAWSAAILIVLGLTIFSPDLTEIANYLRHKLSPY